jgi:hypothetical protein
MTRAALAGVSAFALAYVAAEALRLPVLVYDPIAGTAALSRTISGLSMRYFGDLLFATVAGLSGALAFHSRGAVPLRVPAWTALSLVGLAALHYFCRFVSAR